MAQPADRPPSDRLGGLTNLQKRILSAAVLLPLVIAAIIFGHPYFTLLVALFAGVMAWEWISVVAHEQASPPASPVPVPSAPGWRSIAFLAIVTVVAAVLNTGFDAPASRIGGGILVGALLTGIAARVANRRKTVWFVIGVVYVAVPAAALVAIRADPEFGSAAPIWIIALVVAADTGGYLVGRRVGGPKLAPRISPNKTWSGLGGAVAGAALVGLLTAFMLNHTYVWTLTLVSAGLGLVEQAGDLVESAFKRHFGVKDTSQVIPGHGGVLDRVDGLLAVAVAVVIANEWAGGSVLAW
jgi:phosphatidate cytidylyltransferase